MVKSNLYESKMGSTTEDVRSEVCSDEHTSGHDTDDSFVNENESTDGQKASNMAWSDSVANILKSNNRKSRKKLVLSRAKKISNLPEIKLIPTGFEVALNNGEVKAEHVKIWKIKEQDVEQAPKKLKNDLNIRVKPNILERDRERILSKIATRGVVQLFNAVRVQQKDISAKISEAGPSQVRQENAVKNINKKNFLNILMGKKSESVLEENNNDLNKANNSSWSILQDDYLMSAKLKDWDRQIEEEEEVEME